MLEELIFCSCWEGILGDVKLLSPPALLTLITTDLIKSPLILVYPWPNYLFYFFLIVLYLSKMLLFFFFPSWTLEWLATSLQQFYLRLKFYFSDLSAKFLTAFTSSMSKCYTVGLCENWDLEHQMHHRTPGYELQRKTVTLGDILCQLQDLHLSNMHS